MGFRSQQDTWAGRRVSCVLDVFYCSQIWVGFVSHKHKKSQYRYSYPTHENSKKTTNTKVKKPCQVPRRNKYLAVVWNSSSRSFKIRTCTRKSGRRCLSPFVLPYQGGGVPAWGYRPLTGEAPHVLIAIARFATLPPRSTGRGGGGLGKAEPKRMPKRFGAI